MKSPAERATLTLVGALGQGARSSMPSDVDDESLSDPRLLEVAERFGDVLDALGLDRRDPNLAGTELRVARAYRELLAGLDPGAEPELRTFPNTQGYTAPVWMLDIPFYSLCAHHFLPFFGTAHVAYLPGERLVGLSKLARAVEFFARRPQLQERLTDQVCEFLEERLRPAGVMVVVQGRHLCMEMRGVGRPGVTTTTSAARGELDQEAFRREFFSLLPDRRANDAASEPERAESSLATPALIRTVGL